jgi:hypothetical protein
VDSRHPVTKTDLDAALAATKRELQAALAATKGELQAALAATRDDLRAEITASSDRLTDAMRQIETNLLTEFHRYAKGQNARLHTVEVGETDMKLRLSILEDRVLALEIRNPPSVL